MSNATKLLIPAAAVLGLGACSDEQAAPDDQNIIVDINEAGNADIEAVDSGETVDPLPEDANAASDPRSPEERGDGDDMVNIIDDTQ